MEVEKWQKIYFIVGAYGTRGNEVNICSTMPQNKLDYQKNQESGPKPGHEQLYRNLEIALPLISVLPVILFILSYNGNLTMPEERDRAIGHLKIANNSSSKLLTIYQGRAKEEDAIGKLKQELSIATERGDRAEEIRGYGTL